MKHFFAGLVFGLTLIIASPTIAQQQTNYAQSGFYLGIGGLYAIENFDTTSPVKVDNAPGFNFRVGYRIIPHFAIEAMGERVDKFDLTNAQGKDIDTWTGTINGKAFILTDRFQPYGLFGVGFMRAHATFIDSIFGSSGSDTDLALRFGGGLDSYITEHWVANLEISYVLPTGDVDGLDYISLGGGLQYRF